LFYFYGVWLGDAAPWSFFFIGGVIWCALAWRTLDDGTREAVRLSLVWFFTVLLLFSVSSYKLPHYIMPAYPATALLVGVFGDAMMRGLIRHRLMWRIPAALAAILLLAGAVLVGLLLRRAFDLPLTDPSFVLSALLIAGAASVGFCALTRRDAGGLAALAMTLVASYAWTVTVVSPRELRRFQPIPALGGSVQRIAAPDEPLAVAGNYGAPGLVFYARRPVQQLAGREDVIHYMSGPGRRHLVLPLTDFEAVRGAVPRSWKIVDQGSVFSVRMRRLLERAPERAGRTLVLVSTE
jgi:hypothetical protein